MLDARERAVVQYLRETTKNDDHIYHVGYYSRLSKFLSDNSKNLTRSQFKEGVPSGKVDQNGVLCQDLTKTSFPDKTYDHLVCLEVLEHIPHYKFALSEMFRILKPDGQAILTFPWLGGEFHEHRIRAELLPDGTIRHILPPEFHGDPATKEGILSFRAFGWSILDELREAGFRKVFARYLFGPLHGHMTVLLPAVVAIK